MNGLTGLAVTKLDVLSGQPTLKIARKYLVDGKEYNCMPANINKAAAAQPVYEEVEGWAEEISGVKNYDDLPEKARDYIRRIEDITEIEAVIVSVGPDREETLLLKNPFTD